MAQQIINIGAAPNDDTGDPLRVGGDKINDNFTELYRERVDTVTASEALAAASFGNIHNAGGARVRKANATDDTKPCDCYIPVAIANGDPGTVVAPGGIISGLAGLTPGDVYYLDAVGGAITNVAPSADGSGNLVQRIGKAISATKMLFNPVIEAVL